MHCMHVYYEIHIFATCIREYCDSEVLSLVRVDDASESSSIAASQHQHRPAASAACSGAEAATDAVELEVLWSDLCLTASLSSHIQPSCNPPPSPNSIFYIISQHERVFPMKSIFMVRQHLFGESVTIINSFSKQ